MEKIKLDLDKYFNTCKKLISKKMHDYATKNDIFKNFKESAAIASILSQKKITPTDVFNVFISMKMSREANIRNNLKEAPKNESLFDSIVDEINYIVLKSEFENITSKK